MRYLFGLLLLLLCRAFDCCVNITAYCDAACCCACWTAAWCKHWTLAESGWITCCCSVCCRGGWYSCCDCCCGAWFAFDCCVSLCVQRRVCCQKYQITTTKTLWQDCTIIFAMLMRAQRQWARRRRQNAGEISPGHTSLNLNGKIKQILDRYRNK